MIVPESKEYGVLMEYPRLYVQLVQRKPVLEAGITSDAIGLLQTFSLNSLIILFSS